MTSIGKALAIGASIKPALDLSAEILLAPFSWASRAWRRRQAIRYLNEAPNEMLRDLGITRSGIENVVRHGRQ